MAYSSTFQDTCHSHRWLFLRWAEQRQAKRLINLACRNLCLSEEIVGHRLTQTPRDCNGPASFVRDVVRGAETRVGSRSSRLVLAVAHKEEHVRAFCLVIQVALTGRRLH
jgi:hypothetical protein